VKAWAKQAKFLKISPDAYRRAAEVIYQGIPAIKSYIPGYGMTGKFKPGHDSLKDELLNKHREEALIKAHLMPPKRATGEEAPSDPKDLKIPSGALGEAWKEFHRNLNKETNRTAAKDRAITRAEFRDDRFGAAHRTTVVRAIEGALHHGLAPGTPAAVHQTKIAKEMMRRIPELKKLCH
jgi:hypothetical protein